MGRNAATLAVSVFLCAAVFEVGLRLAGLSYPILHRLEALRGWAPWPGIDGVYRIEGHARVRFNSAGARGPEVAAEKPAGAFRIVVLGDSMTEAREVDEDVTFVARLGEALQDCHALAGRSVETVNFGVSGYGTAQELLTLTSRARAFAPDLVLLALFPGNDILNNSRRLDGHPDRPYYGIDGAWDRTTLDSSRFRWKQITRNATNAAINRSAFLQFTRDAIGRLKYGRKTDGAGARPSFIAGHPADEVMRRPSGGDWEDAWSVTERLLLETRAVAEQAGARFVVGILSVPVQVYPDAAARTAFAERLGIDTLFYPNARLRALGLEHGLAVFSIAERMQAEADRDDAYFHGFADGVLGDGHYNPDGHRVVGDLLADGVCDVLGAG